MVSCPKELIVLVFIFELAPLFISHHGLYVPALAVCVLHGSREHTLLTILGRDGFITDLAQLGSSSQEQARIIIVIVSR